MKKPYFFLILILVIIFIIAISVIFFSLPKGDTIDINFNNDDTISFEYNKLSCLNEYRPDKENYLVGGAVIDINNDGQEEFFISTNEGKKSCLYAFQNGNFIDIIESSGIDYTEVSYGVLSIDIDKNGFADLIIARKSGVYLYLNNNGIFKESLIFNDIQEKGVPVDISSADFDKDGDVDLYISTFISAENFSSLNYNDPSKKQRNIFLENLGNLKFKDKTKEVGLEFIENTFASVFVDLNNDGWEDLVLSNNTNRVYIYKNNKAQFELVSTPTGYGFWMGFAVTDYNNDGLLDLFFSNAGNSIPAIFLHGDLKENQPLDINYAFLENKGDFNFENIFPAISKDSQFFGWGIVAEDFTFDSVDDYLIAQNYIAWPLHTVFRSPGSLLINIDSNLEQGISSAGLENGYHGFSILVGDYNNDGYKDVVYLNINANHSLYISKSKTDKKLFTATFNPIGKYTSIMAEIEFNDKSKILKNLNRKQGVLTTQSNELFFYYPINKTIKKINILSNNKDILQSFEIKEKENSIYIK